MSRRFRDDDDHYEEEREQLSLEEEIELMFLFVASCELQENNADLLRGELMDRCQSIRDRVLAKHGDDDRTWKLILYFIDNRMSRQASRLRHLNVEWRPLQTEAGMLGEGSGDHDFQTIVDECVGQGPSAGKRAKRELEVAFKCLALGFYVNETDRQRRIKVAKKLAYLETGRVRLPGEKHEPDKSKLYKRPIRWLPWVIAGGLTFCVAVVVIYIWAYRSASGSLPQDIEKLRAAIGRPGR